MEHEFTVVNGFIVNPGKFQGETLATPYFYEQYLQNYEGSNGLIAILPGDKIAEPSIPENALAVRWSDDENGFVTLRYFYSDQEIADWNAEYFAEDEQDEIGYGDCDLW